MCLVLLIRVSWDNSSAVFLFKTQWYQCLHARHILIRILMLSTSTCRRCHRVWGYLHCQLQLMRKYWVSRNANSTRDIFHTIHRETYLKFIQYVVMGYICFLSFATNPHQKIHQHFTLIIARSSFALFDTLYENVHEYHFDNFYMSKKCAYTYFTHHPKNIKGQILFHVGEWGVPEEVLQNKVTNSRKSTWLDTSCSFLFIIYYFQVKKLFLLLFPLNYRVPIK